MFNKPYRILKLCKTIFWGKSSQWKKIENRKNIILIANALYIGGKGQNYENQNVQSQKEHQKFEKDQNVESFDLKDQNIERSE